MQSASASRLAAALARELEGEVRFDEGSRALYATDASNYRQVPIGVVLPRTEADVVKTLALCRRHGAPVLPRGGGTSLCGQCCNVAVVIDFSKYMNRILEIDAASRTARVQPGVVLDELRNRANEAGLTFAPDPATHNHNTLGGTRAVRDSASISRMRFMYLEKSSTTATLQHWPHRLVPPPRERMGARYLRHSSTVASTSSAWRGITTPMGTCR